MLCSNVVMRPGGLARTPTTRVTPRPRGHLIYVTRTNRLRRTALPNAPPVSAPVASFAAHPNKIGVPCRAVPRRALRLPRCAYHSMSSPATKSSSSSSAWGKRPFSLSQFTDAAWQESLSCRRAHAVSVAWPSWLPTRSSASEGRRPRGRGGAIYCQPSCTIRSVFLLVGRSGAERGGP